MSPPYRFAADKVKAAAHGRWPEILEHVAGIPCHVLDGKGHPCPKCGGTDRFSLIDAEAGAVHCRHCFHTKNGDGLAAVGWMLGLDFPASLRRVAGYLGLTPLSASGAQGGRNEPNNDARRIVATYDYRDEAGNLLLQVVRFEPKDFRQREPKAGGGWDWSVKGVRVVPYGLPELLGDPSRPVWVCEGEKDCDNLTRLGLVATCNAGGAGKWTDKHSDFLRGRRVHVLPDNDEAGRKHAQQVARTLQGVAAEVRIVELPSLPEKGDASDWLAARRAEDWTGDQIRNELERLAEAAAIWTPAAEPWPELRPFDGGTLPEFPTHVLPQALRDWVAEESHATQTPPDLAALLGLAVCGACIARRVIVEPHPGWREPVNLFVVVVLEPANRKSAVFSDATAPLREFEAEAIERARPVVAKMQSERRQLEARLKKAEKLAAEKDDLEAKHLALELAQELSQFPEPVLPRLIVDDATAEKLGMMLAEQLGRIASMSPEGGVFDLMAGLYSKNGAVQFTVYLKGHAGDDLVTDRVSRESVRVSRPALTCAYAIQPAVIAGLMSQPAFRGRGLLARFLYAVPPSWLGEREITPPPMADGTRDRYRQLVRGLASIQDQVTLRLARGAQHVLVEWQREIEAMLADGGRMEHLRDWGGKLAGATVRLAALMHCIDQGPEGDVSAATMTAAASIARYLIPHAEAALGLMHAHDGTAEDAQYILRWIQRHRLAEFRKTEAQHHGKRRFPQADSIDPALAELEKRGFIRLRPMDATGPGRPPSPTYEVNPAICAIEDSTERSQYSRNSVSEPAGGNSGNNGSASLEVKNAKRVSMTI